MKDDKEDGYKIQWWKTGQSSKSYCSCQKTIWQNIVEIRKSTIVIGGKKSMNPSWAAWWNKKKFEQGGEDVTKMVFHSIKEKGGKRM